MDAPYGYGYGCRTRDDADRQRIIVGRPQARTGPFVLGSSGPDYPLLTLSSYRIGRSVPRGQLEPASSRKRKIGDLLHTL
jgi:hypothetical protein